MISRPCLSDCIAAGRTLTWHAEQELPDTSTTARPCFLSIRRWNSARSRGGIPASSRVISSRALVSSSLMARCSARQSFIRSSCCSVSAGRVFSRSSRSARAFSISSSSSRNRSSVERMSFSTPSISFSAAEYSRLDCTLRSCPWYFFSFSLWSASSPSALRFSSSASVSRALSEATAWTFSWYSRSTSVRSAGTVSRRFSRSWTKRIRVCRR